MKHVLVTLLVAILSISAYGQDVSDHFSRKNALKLSPFEFAQAEFQFSYERYFGERNTSLSIVPSIILQDAGQESKNGFQIMGQYRFYLSHLRNDQQKIVLGIHNFGFYAGVYALYLDYAEDYIRGYNEPFTYQWVEKVYTTDVGSIEGGAMLGLQIDLTKRIVVDIYVGGGIRKSEVNDTIFDDPNQPNIYNETYGIFDKEYTGVKPRAGFQFGFTF